MTDPKPAKAKTGRARAKDKTNMTIAQLATYLQYSPQEILDNLNVIPHITLAGQPRFSKARIDAWVTCGGDETSVDGRPDTGQFTPPPAAGGFTPHDRRLIASMLEALKNLTPTAPMTPKPEDSPDE